MLSFTLFLVINSLFEISLSDEPIRKRQNIREGRNVPVLDSLVRNIPDDKTMSLTNPNSSADETATKKQISSLPIFLPTKNSEKKRSSNQRPNRNHHWTMPGVGNILDISWDPNPPKEMDSQLDLVQPDETHLEGVPTFLVHPKPLYYTMKGHPATIECVAEPVSHAVIQCTERIIPYKGPGESGSLTVTRLDSANQPTPNGDRWHIQMRVRAKEVEEWFGSYKCHCEVWNKVIKLQRPKKVVSHETTVVEAYLDRKFQIEPVSTDLTVNRRLILACTPPKGKPEPEVYWLKNGIRVNSNVFPHILINDYNQLIIENVTTTDSGNYTCVAECLGVEFRQANARVNVYQPVKRKPYVPTITTMRQTPVQPRNLLHTREILIYVGLFMSLAVILGIVAMITLFVKRKQTGLPSFRTFPYSYCFPGKTVHHRQEKNIKQSKDLLLSSEFKQNAMMIKNPSALEPKLTEVYSNSQNSKAVAKHPNILLKQSDVSSDVLASQYQSNICKNEHTTPLTHHSVLITNGNSILNAGSLVPSLSPMQFPPPPSTLPPLPLTPRISENSNSIISDSSIYSGLPNGHHFLHTLSPRVLQPMQVIPYVQPAPYAEFGHPLEHYSQVIPTDSMMMRNMEANEHSGIVTNISNMHPGPATTLSQPLTSNGSSAGQSPANTTTTAVGSGTGGGGGGSSNGSFGQPGQLNGSPPIKSPAFCSTDPTDVMNIIVNDPGSRESSAWHKRLDAPAMEVNEIDSIIQASVDTDGCLLSLANSGVFLYISDGSLYQNTLSNVYLTICHEDSQRPSIKDHQTLLSPIVQFGPADLELRKPVVLSFPHCAEVHDGSWLIRLLGLRINPTEEVKNPVECLLVSTNEIGTYGALNGGFSNSEYTEIDGRSESHWQEICIIDNDSVESNTICQLDNHAVHIVTNVPRRYCLIGEPMKYPKCAGFTKQIDHRLPVNNKFPFTSSSSLEWAYEPMVAKRLRLAAFVVRLSPTMDCHIRVYVLADTKDALQHVIRLEQKMEGRLMNETKPILFTFNGAGLCFRIDEISPGWNNRLQSNIQGIPFRHIWSGSQMSMLHCAFSLEHVNTAISKMSCAITVYQEDRFAQVLHVSNDSPQNSIMDHSGLTGMFSSSEKCSVSFRITRQAKRLLCEMLDFGNDWKKLAKQLRMEKQISQLSLYANPTLCLLEICEARVRTLNADEELKRLFVQIGRSDCVSLLELEPIPSPV